MEAKAEEKRIANQDHRRKIEKGIISDINSVIRDTGIAEKLVGKIKAGEIRNVTINY